MTRAVPRARPAFLLLAALACPAEAQGDPFAAGAIAYERRDFAAARAALESASPAPEEFAAAQINLGHCALEAGRPWDAYVHYLRAQRRRPSDPEVAGWVEDARRQLGLREFRPEGTVERIAALGRRLPARTLLAAAGALGAAGCALALRRRRLLSPVPVAAILLAAALAALPWLRGLVPPGSEILALEEGVPLHGEPSRRSPVAGRLYRGERIPAAAASDRWVEVRAGGRVLYVEISRVALLE